MEALIRALTKLESILEKASGVVPVEHKPVTAHGYVSSDANEVTIVTGKTSNGVVGSNSLECIKGPLNNQTSKNCKQEEGFHSDSSRQLCKYLKELRRAQLLLICHRVTNEVLMHIVTMVSLFRWTN